MSHTPEQNDVQIFTERIPKELTTLLVGGKTANKPTQYETILEAVEKTREADFLSMNLWVSCPKCRSPMNADYIGKNYGFVCKHCNTGIELATLLPRWTDF